MNKILAYIGLQLKLRFTFEKEAKILKRIGSIFGTLLTGAVLLLLLWFFFDKVNGQLAQHISMEDFSIAIILVVEVVLTIAGVLFEIKFLLNPPDIKIVARFPLSDIQIFISEIIIIYGYVFVLSILLFAPIMIVFGFASGLLTGMYVLRLILMLIFAPMIPFALATILAVPTMLIMTALKNHNIIMLCLFIIILVGLFILYNYFLNLLAGFYINQKMSDSNFNAWISAINALQSPFNFFNFVKNLMFGKIGFDMLYIIAILIGGTAIGVGLALPMFGRVRREHLEGNGKFFSKKTKETNDSKFVAIIKKEALDIVRTQTYAYFYLGVAISTPVMVFFISKLMNTIGQAQLGGSVSFGVSILVLSIYMAMINSFAATSISREGKKFYITKIMPFDFRKQLMAKIILNLVVSIGALLISVIIIVSLKFVSPIQSVVLFFSSLLYAMGIIANGYNLNIAKPNLKESLNGEVSESNITSMLSIGLVISAVMGGATVVLSYMFENKYAYIFVLCLAAVYALINIIIFFVTANKNYEKIEFR